MEWILKGIVVAGAGAFLAIKFWRHDDEIRRWTILFCKLAYVIAPVIFVVGLISGGPLSINMPFVHTKTESILVMVMLFAVGLFFWFVLHRLLISQKAVDEFTHSGESLPKEAEG